MAVIAFGMGVKLSGFDLTSLERNKNSKAPADLNYTSVEQLYDRLRQKYDGNLDAEKLIDGMKKGLVEATGDPYTTYFTPKESQDFQDSLDGKFSGIGAELGKKDGQLVVVSPLEGFPAQKAGVKTGDIILQVNGEDASKWSVDQAVSKIRGDKGTTVKIQVARDQKPLEFTITRDDITIPSVKYEVTSDNIGYMQISRFAEDTGALAQKAADEFKSKNVKGVVLDLRGDGGGYLDAAVSVSSLWLDNGQTVVQERQGNKVVDTLQAKGGNVLKGFPTVVLIDGGSASASEITAGALQDTANAKLVGVKSFGKGSVQELQKLNDGSELKVTVARWYTPKGKNIDKEGISPDIEVKMNDDDVAANRDPQKDRSFSFINTKQ
ncbi:MAG TPA: S41 family peptidase [Candidatus Saccharimonadales bacterium]|nr:S41 family peptidase [Candidatus Saccharimonadales bacterium]